jgi:AhpD family alkylhydroperoxidase
MTLDSNSSSSPSDRVATVRPVAENAAADRVARVYEDIKKTKNLDSVPNFWRTLATNPALLESVWTNLKSVMHPEAAGRTSRLDAVTREIIAVAVSATNGCPYCINSHTAALRKLGLDEETLGEVMAVVGLFNMTNALANGYQVEPDVLPPIG